MKPLLLTRGEKSLIAIMAVLAALFFLSYGGGFSLSPKQASAGSGDNMYGFAWSSNIGWISFNCTDILVSLGDCSHDYGVKKDINSIITGYAWSPNIGWIKFPSTSGADSMSGCLYGGCYVQMNQQTYQSGGNGLRGWARACAVFQSGCSGALKSSGELGGWDGWISFSAMDIPACASTPFTSRYLNYSNVPCSYGVYLDINNNTDFRGYAWGGDVVGWISFNCANEGYCNPAYKVATGASLPPPIGGTPSLDITADDSYADISVSDGDSVELSWFDTPLGSSAFNSCEAKQLPEPPTPDVGWAGPREIPTGQPQLPSFSNGLVAFWPFDDGTDPPGPAADVIGGTHKAALVPVYLGASYAPEWIADRFGIASKALHFNWNQNSFLYFPSNNTNPIPDMLTANSVCAWVRNNDFQKHSDSDQTIVQFSNTAASLPTSGGEDVAEVTSNGVRFGMVSCINPGCSGETPGKLFVSYLRGSSGDYSRETANQVITANTWTPICYVFDNSLSAANKVKIYAGCTSSTSSCVPQNTVAVPSVYDRKRLNAIGIMNYTDNPSGAHSITENSGGWAGDIDDIRVYNRALTADEVRDFSSASAPKWQSPPLVAVDGAPTAYTFKISCTPPAGSPLSDQIVVTVTGAPQPTYSLAHGDDLLMNFGGSGGVTVSTPITILPQNNFDETINFASSPLYYTVTPVGASGPFPGTVTFSPSPPLSVSKASSYPNPAFTFTVTATEAFEGTYDITITGTSNTTGLVRSTTVRLAAKKFKAGFENF